MSRETEAGRMATRRRTREEPGMSRRARLFLGIWIGLFAPGGNALAQGRLDEQIRITFDRERPLKSVENDHFSLSGTARNSATTTVEAPISIVVNGFAPAGAALTLLDADGELPDGRRYKEVLNNGTLGPGQEVPVKLRFKLGNGLAAAAARTLEIAASKALPFDSGEQANFSVKYELFRIPAGNHRPVAQAGADQTAPVGVEVLLDGRASHDADGHPLTYLWILSSIPAGSRAVLADPRAAQTSFTPDLPGNYLATLVVSDSFVDSAADTLRVTAAENGQSNRFPEILSVAPTGAEPEALYQYQVLARDLDGETLTYSLEKAPNGMEIDAVSGWIRWLAPNVQHVNYSVIVRVSDPRGGVARQSFSIHVMTGCSCR